MTTTDLKPGDIVKHPEKGRGLVHRRFARNDVGVVYADKDRDGITSYTNDLTGWERVETCTADERRILNDFREVASGDAMEAVYPEAGVVIAPHDAFKQRPELVRPGHVQVRVDDLDPQTLSEWSQYAGCNLVETALLRVGCASIARQAGQGDPTAQRAESTPPADEPEIVGDGCECWVTPEHTWTTYGSAVEPGSQVEYNPRCPKHGEKPTSATVTLPCPDCGEAVTDTATVGIEDEGGYYLTFANSETHTCPPAQPDEPTEFGARVSVTLPDGTREKWCRLGKHHPAPWLGEAYDVPGEAWSLLCGRGTVTIGWDE